MTTNPFPPARVEQAREFLAAEYDLSDRALMSARIRAGRTSPAEDRAIRAIHRALQAGIAEGLERARAWLSNEANAYRHGQENAPDDRQKLYRMGQKDACLLAADAIRTLSDEGAAS